jgi:hypothetical protein
MKLKICIHPAIRKINISGKEYDLHDTENIACKITDDIDDELASQYLSVPGFSKHEEDAEDDIEEDEVDPKVGDSPDAIDAKKISARERAKAWRAKKSQTHSS